ncbi:MAG: hypothetical protein SGARI_002459 [Bacillariaceae sp.]
MRVSLTASSVDAFDDWFSQLDDDDLDLPPASDVKTTAATEKKKETDDLNDSWVDSSDDEDGKTKGPRKEVTRRQSGDLERMMWAASQASGAGAASLPPPSRSGKKPENMALKLLNKEDKKKAKKILENRRAVRDDSQKRRHSVSQCVERQLSGSSRGSDSLEVSDTKGLSPMPPNRQKRVLTPPRAKSSPLKSKSDVVKPVPLAALYGGPLGDGDATADNNSRAEGSFSDVKTEEKNMTEEELSAADARQQLQPPPRRTLSHGGIRDSSSDPLAGSRHGSKGRNTEMDSSRRGASRRNDPLSVSRHRHSGRNAEMDSSRRGVSSAERRRRDDPLSISRHRHGGRNTEMDSLAFS